MRTGVHSWSESEIAGDFSALRVQCVAGGNCIASGYDAPSAQHQISSSPAGEVFYSSDQGSSWTAATMATGQATIGPVNSISCSDAVRLPRDVRSQRAGRSE